MREGKIGYGIIQDEVRKVVKTALEEYFGEESVGEIGTLINQISDKILHKKDENLENFDKAMQQLMATPESRRSGKPVLDLTKILKSRGLL